MTIRMGYWDCPSCGAKKNLGPNATCAGCGLARGPNIAFYTDDSAPVVEDPELVARARAGADWKCKYCDADNRAGVLDCHQCGAGPDGSVKRAVQFAFAPKAPTQASGWQKILAIVAGVLFVLGLGIWALFIRTTALEVTVESAVWERTAALEELSVERKQAWEDEAPSGAKIVDRDTKARSKKVQDGTEKVKVGKKDLGNGMFEDVYEQKPKYVTKQVDDSWVTYEVEEWKLKKLLREETTHGKEPTDPAAGVATGRDQRIGARTNAVVYKLKGVNGKDYTFSVDVEKEGAAAVSKYAVGERYVAQVNAAGAVRKLGP